MLIYWTYYILNPKLTYFILTKVHIEELDSSDIDNEEEVKLVSFLKLNLNSNIIFTIIKLH